MLQSLSTQRVAVTGATGFIGIRVLHALHGAGAHVVAIVVAGRHLERLKALPFPVEVILAEDLAHLGDAVRQAKAEYVVHLSGHISNQWSDSSIQPTLDWNLLSTIGLLTACAEVSTKRVLLMGSCEEYGQNATTYDPALAPNPASPYGASKAAATAYARMFNNSFHLPTVVLRPSVVYGPGQSSRMLIAMVMHALAANQSIAVTQGEQTRDFLYVDDLADAIVLALTTPGMEGGTYNIGSGEIVSVRQCLELIEHITGCTGLIEHGARPYPVSERFHYEPMLEKTYEVLPWKASVMLEEGLRRTWQVIRGAI